MLVITPRAAVPTTLPPSSASSDSGIQTVEDIQRLMREAQQGPNKYNFQSVEDADYSMMIEEEINMEAEEGSHRVGGAARGRPG